MWFRVLLGESATKPYFCTLAVFCIFVIPYKCLTVWLYVIGKIYLADYCTIEFIICDLCAHTIDLASSTSLGEDSADYLCFKWLVNYLGAISSSGYQPILNPCLNAALYNSDIQVDSRFLVGEVEPECLLSVAGWGLGIWAAFFVVRPWMEAPFNLHIAMFYHCINDHWPGI